MRTSPTAWAASSTGSRSSRAPHQGGGRPAGMRRAVRGGDGPADSTARSRSVPSGEGVSSLNRSSRQASPESLSRISRSPFVKGQPNFHKPLRGNAAYELIIAILRTADRGAQTRTGDLLLPKQVLSTFVVRIGLLEFTWTACFAVRADGQHLLGGSGTVQEAIWRWAVSHPRSTRRSEPRPGGSVPGLARI